MTNQSEQKRKNILRQLAEGQLSIDEADQLMEQIELDEETQETHLVAAEILTDSASANTENSYQDSGEGSAKESAIPTQFRKFKWAWAWVLFSGIVLTLLGAFGMYNGYESAGMSWGFWLSWIPLLLGVVITTIALATSNAVWIHVRVHTGQEEWPRRIAISLPLPMFLLRMGMSMGKLNLDGVGKFGTDDIDSLLKVIQESDVPLTVHVDEGGGEKVEVYIGR